MSTISENAKAIFLEAVENHSPEKWPEFLEQACDGDRDLRGIVEGLLWAHSEKDSLFDRVQATRDYQPPVRTGQVIGPYKIREQIGDGGMGVVYVAQQEKPLRRKVALKVIKPGMDSREVLARFDAERNALALMNHPSIAKVLDAGATEHGHPYFVMELIQGKPVTEYCDQKKLTIKERLELFTEICNAVQHAHQKGVIHRDIKPTNILVTEIDGKPVPKVIDFGVAKALGANLTDRTVYTSFQALVGTPLYMSPEQTQLSGVDVDTSSDVYALGILLYELLTGTTPLSPGEVKQVAQDEVLRRIRETEPPRPSNRISSLGETSSQVSACRGAQPDQLGRTVRGDLDWIVMKALEKDRNRRYKTADAFAADIGRHLTNEPVEARPPSTAYRLGRFYRRNKVPVCFGIALAVVSVTAMYLTTILWLRAEQRLIDLRSEVEEDALNLAMRGQVEAALKETRLAEQLGTPRSWSLMIEGIARLASGELRTAIEMLEEAKQNYPDSIPIRGSLTTAYLYSGLTDKYVQEMDELALMSPSADDPYAMIFKAHALYHQESARALIDDYFGRHQDTPFARIARALVLARAFLGTDEIGLLEQAERDAIVGMELTDESDFAVAATIIVHRFGCAYAKSTGDTALARHHASRLESLATRLPGDSYNFGPIARFYEDRDEAQAERLWQRAIANGLAGYQLCGRAAFLVERERLEEAISVLENDPYPDQVSRMMLAILTVDRAPEKALAEFRAQVRNSHPALALMTVGLLVSFDDPSVSGLIDELSIRGWDHSTSEPENWSPTVAFLREVLRNKRLPINRPANMPPIYVAFAKLHLGDPDEEVPAIHDFNEAISDPLSQSSVFFHFYRVYAALLDNRGDWFSVVD